MRRIAAGGGTDGLSPIAEDRAQVWTPTSHAMGAVKDWTGGITGGLAVVTAPICAGGPAVLLGVPADAARVGAATRRGRGARPAPRRFNPGGAR